MAEDLRVTKRFFSSIKSVQIIKSYLKNWRSGISTTTTTSLVSSTGTSEGRGTSRIRNRQTTQETRSLGPTDTIHLFPGWAVRRYVDDDRNKFDIHVHVSGYATTQRSRGQRTFLRIAKGYAALNKLAETHNPRSSFITDPGSSRTADESKDDEHLHDLEEAYKNTLQNFNAETSELPCHVEESFHPSSNESPMSVLRRWETNLEKRIQIVLGNSMLSSRAVNIELFVSEHHDLTNSSHHASAKEGLHLVGRHEALTGADGLFQHEFVISWDNICHRPIGHYNYGERVKEHELILHADLSPPQYPAGGGNRESKTEVQVIPITHAPIRVISDIDDTIKFSNILGGARAVFRNVFVHDLEETTIPGMSEWYTDMWQKGVRFHYVSNGPLQMLPLIKAFLHVSKLPSGSIRLKSYATRSIFSDLLTPPADRKREGLDKVLKSFPDSKFILIGDSGEQDLELYAQVAKLYPNQILAILVRDVESDVDPIGDPTGKEWKKHVMSRINSEVNVQNALSRSSSVFSSVFRPARQKSRTSSVYDLPSPSASIPPSRSATIDDTFQIQDFTPETPPISPVVSEPEQMVGGHFSMHHSSSPSLVTPLSEVDRKSSPILIGSQHSENGARGKKSEDLSYGAQEEVDKRRSAIMFLEEEPALSQSPERMSVLKANMKPGINSSPKPTHKGVLTRAGSTSSATRSTVQNRPSSRRRLQTTDEVPPSISSRAPRRPIRRNTTGLPSDSGNSITSPSILSLTSKYRGMSESERKRAELQERVWRARRETPEHVILRIFRQPMECVEVEELLKSGGL